MNTCRKALLGIFLAALLIPISYALISGSSTDNTSYKKVIEQFIADDFNFNGGKNDFSTVGNDNLKRYLVARNDFKAYNNKENNAEYSPFNERFTFEYKDVSDVGNNTKKVSLYVNENFDYTMMVNDKKELTKDAGVGNDYIIYVSDIGNGNWKIMSANIECDIDPIDGDYDVNSVLGYNSNVSKREKLDTVIQNINQKKHDLKKR